MVFGVALCPRDTVTVSDHTSLPNPISVDSGQLNAMLSLKDSCNLWGFRSKISSMTC